MYEKYIFSKNEESFCIITFKNNFHIFYQIFNSYFYVFCINFHTIYVLIKKEEKTCEFFNNLNACLKILLEIFISYCEIIFSNTAALRFKKI